MSRPRPLCGSLFSGGGLSDLGAVAAGFAPALAVEHSPEIAEVYADNFGDKHLLCADVRAVDYRPYEGIDLLMASPVCTRASVANANRGEAPLDRECAEATARALREIRPKLFLLENVIQYRDFDSFKTITRALDDLGYWWDAHHLNAADHGVPQSRRRLVVRASRVGWLPPLPAPVRPWVGWYAAIEDLLPDCPETKLADWQLKRLPSEILDGLLFGKHYDQPSDNDDRACRTFRPAEPAPPVLQRNDFRAVLVNGIPDNHAGDLSGLGVGRPAPPVTASQDRHPMRAVLVHGTSTMETRAAAGSAAAVVASVHAKAAMPRAVIVSGTEQRNMVTCRADEPVWSQTAAAGYKGPPRAILPECARVVSVTERCLARFQSVPDSYRLPAKKKLACTVIGNGCAVEMIRRIAQDMKEALL